MQVVVICQVAIKHDSYICVVIVIIYITYGFRTGCVDKTLNKPAELTLICPCSFIAFIAASLKI